MIFNQSTQKPKTSSDLDTVTYRATGYTDGCNGALILQRKTILNPQEI
jgi:hypothetical protein